MKIVGDLDMSCFIAMEWVKARLQLFIEIIERELIMNLRHDSFFKDFGKERKIGDRKKTKQACFSWLVGFSFVLLESPSINRH